MVIYTDNTGAIDVIKNYSTTGRTRHSQIKLNYLREHHEEGHFDLEHIGTLVNQSDALTKNNPRDLHQTHSAKLTFDLSSA